MARVTCRLPSQEYQTLHRVAKSSGSTISDAIRLVINNYDNALKLMNTIDNNSVEILQAIAACHESSNKAREAVFDLGKKNLANMKVLGEWLYTKLSGDKE